MDGRKYSQTKIRTARSYSKTQTYSHYNIDKTILGVRNDEGDEWIASFNLVSKKLLCENTNSQKLLKDTDLLAL